MAQTAHACAGTTALVNNACDAPLLHEERRVGGVHRERVELGRDIVGLKRLIAFMAVRLATANLVSFGISVIVSRSISFLSQQERKELREELRT